MPNCQYSTNTSEPMSSSCFLSIFVLVIDSLKTPPALMEIGSDAEATALPFVITGIYLKSCEHSIISEFHDECACNPLSPNYLMVFVLPVEFANSDA